MTTKAQDGMLFFNRNDVRLSTKLFNIKSEYYEYKKKQATHCLIHPTTLLEKDEDTDAINLTLVSDNSVLPNHFYLYVLQEEENKEEKKSMLTVKTYLSVYIDGGFAYETSAVEVTNREITFLDSLHKWATSFYFYDKAYATIEGVSLESKPYNRSATYYICGEVFTLEEVKEQMPELKTLIRNMEANKKNKVIKTRTGRFDFIGDDDTVLDIPNEN